MTFLVAKYIHLIGSAVPFGTGMGIAFFAWFGWRQALPVGRGFFASP
jgi:uncharacterized membrane protein